MSSQGVRIMKPADEEFASGSPEIFINKSSSSRALLVLIAIFSLLSITLAGIVFTQHNF